MAEAIAAGIMLPDGTFAGWDGHRHAAQVNLTEKPKMWEVTLSGGDRPKEVIDDWEDTLVSPSFTSITSKNVHHSH